MASPDLVSTTTSARASEILAFKSTIRRLHFLADRVTDLDDCDFFDTKTPPGHWEVDPLETVQSNTYLCDVCRQSLDYMAQTLQEYIDHGSTDEDGLLGAIIHHPSPESLHMSAMQLCHICILLVSFTRFDYEKLDPELAAGVQIELCWDRDRLTQPDHKRLGAKRLHFVQVNTKLERSSANNRTMLRLQLWPASECTASFASHPGLQARGLVAGRETTPMTEDGFPSWLQALQNGRKSLTPLMSMESESSVSHARRWLAECHENKDGLHDECNSHAGDWFPSRLLDVSRALSTGSLHLLETAQNSSIFSEPASYITLSHRWGIWGAANAPVLTHSCYQRMVEDGILIQTLPKTFGDALKICSWFNGTHGYLLSRAPCLY